MHDLDLKVYIRAQNGGADTLEIQRLSTSSWVWVHYVLNLQSRSSERDVP